MADSDLTELLQRVRAGEAEAAAELVRRYEPQIRQEIRFRLRDRRLRRLFDSIDVCQSVFSSFFLQAANGGCDLDRPDQLVHFLIAIARNKFAECSPPSACSAAGSSAGRRGGFGRVQGLGGRGRARASRSPTTTCCASSAAVSPTKSVFGRAAQSWRRVDRDRRGSGWHAGRPTQATPPRHRAGTSRIGFSRGDGMSKPCTFQGHRQARISRTTRPGLPSCRVSSRPLRL